MTNNARLGASFRDPSGFLFRSGGDVYRQVNQKYKTEYDLLVNSGLFDGLVKDQLLIPHEVVDLPAPDPVEAYCIIRPEQVGFISYPYEWSFSQLKDAALATLEIEKRALDRGMTLKDASAYNIQFHKGRPVLIDSLSFERYQEGQPWIAYRQFCQHFLAPLALMAYPDIRLNQLLRIYIDGVPLDLASKLLPFRTRLDFSLLSHIHLHANVQKRYAGKAVNQQSYARGMNRMAFEGLIDNLRGSIHKLSWHPVGTEWADYYGSTNYDDRSFEAKKQIVADFLTRIDPQSVWDLGANNGMFSRIASDRGIPTIAFDIDPSAVEQNYRQVVRNRETCILPLVMDIANPSPGIGWELQERSSLIERGPVEAVLALALIHHLAISNNVPLVQLAEFFNRLGKWLIIEFVPKEDSQVQRLLASREDIFPDYTREGFERAFTSFFQIRDTQPIPDSQRTLYLLENRLVDLA